MVSIIFHWWRRKRHFEGVQFQTEVARCEGRAAFEVSEFLHVLLYVFTAKMYSFVIFQPLHLIMINLIPSHTIPSINKEQGMMLISNEVHHSNPISKKILYLKWRHNHFDPIPTDPIHWALSIGLSHQITLIN